MRTRTPVRGPRHRSCRRNPRPCKHRGKRSCTTLILILRASHLRISIRRLRDAAQPENGLCKAIPAAPSRPNVLAQLSGDTTDYHFPIIIADEGSFADLDLSVKF